MSTPSNSTLLIAPSRSGAQGFRSRMLWETVKFNFALVGLGLGSESLAKLFRDDSPILTIVEPPPTASVDQPIFDEGLLEEGAIESPIAGGDKHEAEQTDAAIAGTPAEQAPVDAPADAGNLAIRAERAKSVLDGLNLDTAIRLRWVLRDISAKRTNLSPISQNDLMALIELGLIEMQNDEPTLTNEGMRAIAHSTGPTGPNEGERGE